MRWTLPNILTLARICLTPVLALLPFIQGYWPKVIAFLIFIAASASDVVDGYLARRRNQVSELGQLLDPIADKLLLFATLKSEEHTSELQSLTNLVCRLLLEKKKKKHNTHNSHNINS